MSLHEREAPPLAGECASGALFLALPVKNGPLPAELKLRENSVIFMFGLKKYGVSNEMFVKRDSASLIRWIVIYPVDSTIQRLNNRGVLSVHVTIFVCCVTLFLFLFGAAQAL